MLGLWGLEDLKQQVLGSLRPHVGATLDVEGYLGLHVVHARALNLETVSRMSRPWFLRWYLELFVLIQLCGPSTLSQRHLHHICIYIYIYIYVYIYICMYTHICIPLG